MTRMQRASVETSFLYAVEEPAAGRAALKKKKIEERNTKEPAACRAASEPF